MMRSFSNDETGHDCFKIILKLVNRIQRCITYYFPINIGIYLCEGEGMHIHTHTQMGHLSQLGCHESTDTGYFA